MLNLTSEYKLLRRGEVYDLAFNECATEVSPPIKIGLTTRRQSCVRHPHFDGDCVSIKMASLNVTQFARQLETNEQAIRVSQVYFHKTALVTYSCHKTCFLIRRWASQRQVGGNCSRNVARLFNYWGPRAVCLSDMINTTPTSVDLWVSELVRLDYQHKGVYLVSSISVTSYELAENTVYW